MKREGSDPFLELAGDFSKVPEGFDEVRSDRRVKLIIYHAQSDPYRVLPEQPTVTIERIAAELGFPGCGKAVYDYLMQSPMPYPASENPISQLEKKL